MRKAVPTLALLTLLLSAVGGCTPAAEGPGVASVSASASTPSGSGANGATTGASLLEQGLTYARCMREHGVPMPDPVVNGDGLRIMGVEKDAVDGDTLARAEGACSSSRPVLSGPDLQAKVGIAREYSRCMREHGVAEYPDPDAGGRVQTDPRVHDDPQYDTAKTVCDEQQRSRRTAS